MKRLSTKRWNSAARIIGSHPDDAVEEVGGELTLQAWSVLKNLDMIARRPAEESSPRTCCCGGLALAIVLLAYTVLAFRTFFEASPNISITNTAAGENAGAPIPDIGISIGEDYPIEAINASTLLKHVTPTLTYRTLDMKHSYGKVAKKRALQYKLDADCDFPGAKTMNVTFLCLLRDSPRYEVKATMSPMNEETKQRMGNKDVEEYTEFIENLKFVGRYNEDLYSFLEMKLEVNTTSFSAFREEFMVDSNGRERKLKTNLWFRFDREVWNGSAGLERGEWAWYIYYRLPVYRVGENMGARKQFNVDLTGNHAQVGPMQPFTASQQAETEKDWFSWEMTWPTDVPDSPWNNGVPMLDIDIQVGRKARQLHVTYPTLADVFTALGGDYNVALFCGLTWASLLSYFLMCCFPPKQDRKDLEAKTTLEKYCFATNAKIIKKKWRDKIADDDKDVIKKAIQDTFDWLEEHQLAEEEEFEAKQAELMNIVNPILLQIHPPSDGGNGMLENGMSDVRITAWQSKEDLKADSVAKAPTLPPNQVN